MRTNVMEIKEKEYAKLPLKSVEQIYGVITTNLPDDYVYNSNTTVLIVDNVEKELKEYKIPENELDSVNEITHLARGTYINDLSLQ